MSILPAAGDTAWVVSTGGAAAAGFVGSVTVFSLRGPGVGGPPAVMSMRGNRDWTGPSGWPVWSRPQRSASGLGSASGRPSITKMRRDACGITGHSKAPIRRMASSRRYRNAWISVRRSGSFTASQGASATILWLSCPIQLQTRARAPA